LDRQFKHVQ